MNKLFDLKHDSMEIIHDVMAKNGFESEVQAVRYILKKHSSFDEQLDALKGQMEMMTAVLKHMEPQQDILFDAVNTILIDGGITVCKPATLLESNVYKDAAAHRRERLSHKKQKKNWEKNRGAKFSTL